MTSLDIKDISRVICLTNGHTIGIIRMFKKLNNWALIGLLLLPFSSIHADPSNDLEEFRSKLTNEWLLVKNDRLRKIKTYARLEDGKRYRSFKVEAILDSSVEAGVRVLLDAENYTKWYWEVFESRLLKQASPTEYFIYLKHRAPVSLPDRDVILHAVVTPQKKPTDSIVINVKAAPDYIPEAPPLIRMPAEDMIAEFTPLPNNQVKLVAEGYVDPGGNMASWAINFVQRSGPYTTLLGMRRMLQQPELINSKMPLPFPVYNFDNLSQLQ